MPALRALADLLAAEKRSEEAAELYKQVIAAQPGYFQPRLELGVFYYFRGMYAEAEAELSRAIVIAPQLAQARQNLAAVLVDTGQYTRAEQELQQALTFERTADTLAGMGSLLAYQGRHAESAYHYEQAVALGPEDYLLLSNLADSYRRTGRGNDAHATYAKALAAALRELNLNPSDAYTRSYIAYLHARLGHGAAAEREIRAAIAAAPGNGKVLKRAILLFHALGRGEEALAFWRAAPPAVASELKRHPDLAGSFPGARL